MKKMILILLLLTLVIGIHANQLADVPKNVKILSQSCTMTTLFVTVIDLSNNEIVILEYLSKIPGFMSKHNGKLVNVSRTGMIVEPEKQLSYSGQDNPKKKKDDN